MASKVKVRFHPIADQVGGYFFAAWTGWILVGFAVTTLHTAPLSRNFLGGAFQPTPESRMIWTAPDRQFLALVHKLSTPKSLGQGGGAEASKPRFDPEGEFILKYAARRAQLEKEPGGGMVEGLRTRREWGDPVE